MFDNIGNTTYKQIFFLGILIMISLLIIGFGGMLIASSFWSTGDILAAKDYILDSPARINYMKMVQFLTMFSTFFLPPVLLTFLIKDKKFSFLYLNRGINGQQSLMTIVLFIISIPLIVMLTDWNASLHLPSFLASTEEWMRDKEVMLTGVTTAFMTTSTYQGLLINILLMAVLPAFGEEFIFRGLLMKWFSKGMNIHMAIIVSSFIFSAIHIQFLGFFPRFFMGMMLGYVFYWSGSLWASILLHFLNNAITVISYFLLSRGVIQNDPASMGGIDNIPILLINILMFGGVVYWFYRNRTSFQL